MSMGRVSRAVLFLFPILLSQARGEIRYTVTAVGPTTGSPVANGINDQSQIVGSVGGSSQSGWFGTISGFTTVSASLGLDDINTAGLAAGFTSVMIQVTGSNYTVLPNPPIGTSESVSNSGYIAGSKLF